MKDKRQLLGLWTVIAVMVGFAALDPLGSVQLDPNPPDEVVVAFLVGILVGVGAASATGWVTTHFYRINGRSKA